MNRNEDIRRIVIVMTESTPVQRLWETAMRTATETPADVLAVFIHDERWERAASLPFTREVSSVGGGSADFTQQRAEQLLAESAAGLRARINRLARKAGRDVAFQVLPESDEALVRNILGQGKSIIVGSRVLAEHPLYVEFTTLARRVVLIESTDAED